MIKYYNFIARDRLKRDGLNHSKQTLRYPDFWFVVFSSYNFNPSAVCFQCMKVNYNLFGRLKTSFSAFGCTQLHPLVSLLVAQKKDGDGQNAELEAKNVYCQEVKVNGTFHCNISAQRQSYASAILDWQATTGRQLNIHLQGAVHK